MNISHAFQTRTSLRGKLILQLVAWTMPFYIRFFKRNKKKWQLGMTDLKQYDNNSLGNHLANFLERENLTLMPKLEEHDVMHVLFAYVTTIQGEIQMQFFLLGTGKRSLYAFGTALLGALLLPEYWGQYYRDYKRGRNCLNFSKWDFEHLLCEPIDTLRQLIFQQKTEDAPLFI